MTRSVTALMLICISPILAGCDTSTMNTVVGPQFVAANSSTVIIDLTPNNAAALDQGRAMAVEKCALFGGNGAVLESLNVVAGNRERASFLCR